MQVINRHVDAAYAAGFRGLSRRRLRPHIAAKRWPKASFSKERSDWLRETGKCALLFFAKIGVVPLLFSVYAIRSDRQQQQRQMAMPNVGVKTAAQQLAEMQKCRARLDARIQSKASKIAAQTDKEKHRQLLRLGELLLDQCNTDDATKRATVAQLDQRLTRLVDRQLFAVWGLPVRLRGLCKAKPLPLPAPGWAFGRALPPTSNVMLTDWDALLESE